MKITLLQHDIVWGQPGVNLERLSKSLETCQKTDLFVLPEMFATGFCTRPSEVVGSASFILKWMKEEAARLQVALAGTVAVAEGTCSFNRFYFVKPDGGVCYYDKRHLFTYGGENLFYKAGNSRVVVNWRGVRILLQVCYDLRFPVWVRSRRDYDLILYVASWPSSRIEAWHTLLRARAIENQCYVAGVNRIGNDPVCTYCGGTALIDAYGRTVGECDDGNEGEITATLDLEKLNKFRTKFPVLDDGDNFDIKIGQ